MKYHDPNLIHTCINVMIIIRSFSLFCYALVIVCFYIFVMCAILNGSVPKFKYVSKIPGITKFINSKSREYKKDRDGEDAECSICLQNFKDEPDKMIAELNCSSKHVFHKDCLIQWVEKNDICPLCREKIP